MKIAQVEVGGRYTAKVSGVVTTVRVLALRGGEDWGGAARTRIHVVNERTGRRTTFRSAGRLRGRLYAPAGGFLYEDAMIEYHANRDKGGMG